MNRNISRNWPNLFLAVLAPSTRIPSQLIFISIFFHVTASHSLNAALPTQPKFFYLHCSKMMILTASITKNLQPSNSASRKFISNRRVDLSSKFSTTASATSAFRSVPLFMSRLRRLSHLAYARERLRPSPGKQVQIFLALPLHNNVVDAPVECVRELPVAESGWRWAAPVP